MLCNSPCALQQPKSRQVLKQSQAKIQTQIHSWSPSCTIAAITSLSKWRCCVYRYLGIMDLNLYFIVIFANSNVAVQMECEVEDEKVKWDS